MNAEYNKAITQASRGHLVDDLSEDSELSLSGFSLGPKFFPSSASVLLGFVPFLIPEVTVSMVAVISVVWISTIATNT